MLLCLLSTAVARLSMPLKSIRRHVLNTLQSLAKLQQPAQVLHDEHSNWSANCYTTSNLLLGGHTPSISRTAAGALEAVPNSEVSVNTHEMFVKMGDRTHVMHRCCAF